MRRPVGRVRPWQAQRQARARQPARRPRGPMVTTAGRRGPPMRWPAPSGLRRPEVTPNRTAASRVLPAADWCATRGRFHGYRGSVTTPSAALRPAHGVRSAEDAPSY
jgi:hypothetical protein